MKRFTALLCLLFSLVFVTPSLSTVTVSTTKVIYAGQGSTGPFPFSFPIYNASDLLVIEYDSSATETQLTLNVDYTVSGLTAGTQSTGNVTLTSALPSGYTLVIMRSMPYLQSQSWQNLQSFTAGSINDGLDKLEMQIQQVKEETDRAFQAPLSFSGSNVMPMGPSSLLGWNLAGNALQLYPMAPISYRPTPTLYATEYSGSTWDAKIMGAHAACPSSGGCIIDASGLTGSQSMAGNVVISKPGVKLIFASAIQLAMGNYQILIQTSATGFDMESPVPWGGGSLYSSSSPVRLFYTGNASAIQDGDPTADAAWMNDVVLKNLAIDITGAGSAASGIYSNRNQNHTLDKIYVSGKTSAGNTQKGIFLWGGNGTTPNLNYSEFVTIYQPSINGCTYPVYADSGSGGVNASQMIGGILFPRNTTDAVGFHLSGEFTVMGTDVEIAHIGYDVPVGSLHGFLRYEGNTLDYRLGALATACDFSGPNGTFDISASNASLNHPVMGVGSSGNGWGSTPDNNWDMRHSSDTDWTWDFRQLGTASDHTFQSLFRDKSANVMVTETHKDSTGGWGVALAGDSGGGRIQLKSNGATVLQGGSGALYLNPYAGTNIYLGPAFTTFVDNTGRAIFGAGVELDAINHPGSILCQKADKSIGYCTGSYSAGGCTCN